MDISSINQAIPSFGSPTLEGLDTVGSAESGNRIGGSTARQYVRFYKKKLTEPYAVEVEINARTGLPTVKKTGIREIEREMLHCKTPGDTNEYDGEAQDFHRRNFFRHYSAYRSGKAIPLGQSIDECTYVSPEAATELRYLGVYTEEQLAEALDILCDSVPNGYDLREFARVNVRARAENAASPQIALLRQQMAEMQETIRRQAEQMASMQGIVDPSGEPVAEVAKRGRPRKIDLEA